MEQSHHQLQDALDVGLATQALVHIMRFDNTLHIMRPAAGDDFVIINMDPFIRVSESLLTKTL